MKKAILPALLILIAAQSPAYAINDKYRKQLEQSGCTQISETQGCDIHKSKAENAKAGFTNPAADSDVGAKQREASKHQKTGATND
jgi:hypothetical protein